MEIEKTKNNYYPFIMTLLFLLLLVNTLPRTEFRLYELGDWSTFATFLLMTILLVVGWVRQRAFDRDLIGIYITFTAFLSLFILSYLFIGRMELFPFIKLVLFMFFILGAIHLRWNVLHIKIVGYIFSLAILLFFIDWIFLGFTFTSFKSIFRNENFLAVFLFSTLFFQVLATRYSSKFERYYFIVILLLNLLLILTTSARSVLIGIAITLASWVILKQYRKGFPYLIYIVMAGNLLFVGLYVALKNTSIGNYLNELSLSIFNKNIFSGRNEIWEGIIYAIIEKPLLGHGLGTIPSHITETDLSAHNMYLQLMLEFGVIGFLLFLVFIVSIWNALMKRLDSYVAKWSACFMSGILVYESFELTLFQNNYSIAAIQWLIMTIGVGFTASRKELWLE